MSLATIFQRLKGKFALRGRFVDYWSFVHLGVGLAVGYVLASSGVGFGAGLLIATALFIAWECIEPSLHRLASREFPERWTNQVADVVIGAAGYAIGFLVSSPKLMLAVLFEMCSFITR